MSVYNYNDLIKPTLISLNENTIYQINPGKSGEKLNAMKFKSKHDYRVKLMKGDDQGLSVEFDINKDLSYDELENYVKNENEGNKDIKKMNKKYKAFTVAATVYARDEIKNFITNNGDSKDISDKIDELQSKAGYFNEGKLKELADKEWDKRNKKIK